MSARQRHDRIERWGASVIALYLDRGVITEWPFELTRHGRWVARQDDLHDDAGPVRHQNELIAR